MDSIETQEQVKTALAMCMQELGIKDCDDSVCMSNSMLGICTIPEIALFIKTTLKKREEDSDPSEDDSEDDETYAEYIKTTEEYQYQSGDDSDTDP